MTPEQKARCQWRRCYKLVSLLHTNRRGEFFLYGGLRVLPGKAHESPVLYQMVKDFVQYHGRGVMRRLIIDRDFIDGVEIGHCKKELGVDVLIRVKQNMDVYQDVVGLAQGGRLTFQPYAVASAPVHVPERIGKREAARQKTLAARKAKAAAQAPAPASIAAKTVRPSKRAAGVRAAAAPAAGAQTDPLGGRGGAGPGNLEHVSGPGPCSGQSGALRRWPS